MLCVATCWPLLPGKKKKKEKISKLEVQHKSSLARKVAAELADARTLLREELYKRARKRQMLSQYLFYEQGNKPGKLLAKFTQSLCSTVHHVVDKHGVIYSKNEDIARQFCVF